MKPCCGRSAYDLFEIVKWQEDENHCVTAVTGRFERVVTDDDCETGEYANNGPVRPGFELVKDLRTPFFWTLICQRC